MALLIEGRPLRTVLWWQLAATAAAAVIAGCWAGAHGAWSAALGGGINLAASVVFGCVATRSDSRTAGEILRTVIRAEVSKVALIVILLWLVLSNYKQLEAVAFFATFAATIVLFSMAILIREK